MAENKTKPNSTDPREFIATIENQTRREDALLLLEMLEEITAHPPVIWGDSLIGFDQYHYQYASGHEGDYFKIGFSPRKANMVVYLMSGVKQYASRLDSMGPYKTGASCLYLGSLKKLDLDVLRAICQDDYQAMCKRYDDKAN